MAHKDFLFMSFVFIQSYAYFSGGGINAGLNKRKLDGYSVLDLSAGNVDDD